MFLTYELIERCQTELEYDKEMVSHNHLISEIVLSMSGTPLLLLLDAPVEISMKKKKKNLYASGSGITTAVHL